MAIQFIPLAWAVLGRGAAVVGRKAVQEAVKRGATRMASGSLPPRLATISGRAFTAGDLVYTGVAVTDFFTDEELVRSELGRTVMDVYGTLMLARFGGSAAKFVAARSPTVVSGATRMAGAVSGTTRVAASATRRILQKKYANAQMWVSHMPRLQGSLSQFAKLSATSATRTWTKVYDKSRKAWMVLDNSGRPMIQITRDGFQYLRTDKVALRNVALAGGTLYGAKLMFEMALIGDDTPSTGDEALDAAKVRGREKAVEVVGEYLDYLANSLYPGADDYGNDGEPADFLRKLLTHPSSTYRSVAFDLGTSATSNTTEEAVLMAIADAVKGILEPTDSQDAEDPHLFITDNIELLYDDVEEVQDGDPMVSEALPSDDDRVVTRVAVNSSTTGERGNSLFAQ